MRLEWKGEEGEYCQLPSPLQTNNVWCSGGIENTKLTVLLVVGEGSFAQLLLRVTTQHQKLHFLMLLTAVIFNAQVSNGLDFFATLKDMWY